MCGGTDMLIFLSLLETDEERREFYKLYLRYGNAMLLVAKKYFGSDQYLAEDAVQNAWMRAIENFQKILAVPCEKRGAYLVIIVRNESISILRKRKPEVQYDDEFSNKVVHLEGNDWSIRETIRQMPELYRSILEMRFVEELTVKEIADKLELPLATVNSRVYRGRALLIQKLRREGYSV